MTSLELIAYVFTGIVIAIASTMAGIGGGAFMVPLFYFLGLGISNAIGTSKFVITFLSLTATINYVRMKRVPVNLGIYFLVGMVPASYLGVYTLSLIDQNIVKIIISLFLLFYSTRLLVRLAYFRFLNRSSLDPLVNVNEINIHWSRAIPIGLFSGFIAGLTGTGGGVINMPIFLGLLHIPIHTAVALSTFLIFPSSVAATVRHVLNGDVVYEVGIPFTIGAVIGACIGPRLAGKMSRDMLRLVIGIVLSYIGLRMLYTSIIDLL